MYCRALSAAARDQTEAKIAKYLPAFEEPLKMSQRSVRGFPEETVKVLRSPKSQLAFKKLLAMSSMP